MTAQVDPERFEAAASRFRMFFTELSQHFVERDDVLTQIALGLLGREHVLMTGSPGTAKSALAAAVLRRIVDATSGEPSVYARQFTESTVQTDLIGPINFKTLVETGRTEHFTDQGMLGAVHAFLDEVFDGRDMLLRTALNVLHERELKEGTRTTRGDIECAVMTTNRYLAEVMESSRETLLAFVDRIAYLNFVPRGFAREDHLAHVLRTQLGAGDRALRARLTIQDLDVLQDAVDAVSISSAACAKLVQLLSILDADLAAAERADPQFVPTRFFSTRTAVRAGRVLKCAALYDRIFHKPDRPMQVIDGDFAMLRLQLLLGGPETSALDPLLARETDPRERRQLIIIRTEREVFTRALARLPSIPVEREPIDDVPSLEALAERVAQGEPDEILRTAERVVDAMNAGGRGAAEAARVLEDLVSRVKGPALRLGLTLGAHEGTAAQRVERFVKVADELERTPGVPMRVPRWMRGRAIALVEDIVATRAPKLPALLGTLEKGAPDADAVSKLVASELARFDAWHKQRTRLISLGAESPDAVEVPWGDSVAALERDLTALWDLVFVRAVHDALQRDRAPDLAKVFAQLGPVFAQIDATATRLEALGEGRKSTLKRDVIGPRVAPLVQRLVARMDVRDRAAVVPGVDALLRQLQAAGLGDVLTCADLLAWVAEALVRSAELAEHPGEIEASREGYAAVQAATPRAPLSYVLVDLVLRLHPWIARELDDGAQGLAAVAEALAGLPYELRTALAREDLDRVDRVLGCLERWWEHLAPAGVEIPTTDVDDHARALRESGFFAAVEGDDALTRMNLDARMVEEALPEHATAARELRRRIELLQTSSQGYLHRLMRLRVDQQWHESLARLE